MGVWEYGSMGLLSTAQSLKLFYTVIGQQSTVIHISSLTLSDKKLYEIHFAHFPVHLF
jgi:hypothetical protein